MRKSGRNRTLILSVALAAAAALPGRAAAPGQEALFRAFEEHGIPFDAEAVAAAGAAAMIRAVDPHAYPAGADTIPAGTVTNRVFVEASEALPHDILYARLRGLYGTNVQALSSFLEEQRARGGTGTILDLRGAAGDSLRLTDAVAGLFAPPGAALYEVRNGLGEVLETHRTSEDGEPRERPPLIVLTDRGTRGPAEALAAACRHLPGAMLVGEPTYGDAGLRETVSFAEDAVWRIATRWIVMPDGERYDRTGVQPHIEVTRAIPQPMAATNAPSAGNATEDADRTDGEELTEKERENRRLAARVAGDPVLSRAADILLGLRALDRRNETAASSAEPEPAPEDEK